MDADPDHAAAITEKGRELYDGDKPPHEIEEDIARTRVQLGSTIEALGREMAPRRVGERSVEVLRRALEPGQGPFRDQGWAYAIPLALILTGLGWLFALRRRAWQAERCAEAPAGAAAMGETSAPASACADDAGPADPVSRAVEKTVG
jgi:Protein of unknown function (DUF3618)